MAAFTFLPSAYFEGKFIPFEEAKLSVATHALHYGTAAYGGMRGLIDRNDPNSVVLFRLDEHARRMSNSAAFLKYEISQQKIKETIVEFVKQNKPTADIYIRPLVYTSDLGIVPRLHEVEKDFLIYGIEFGDYFPPSITCCFSSWYRQEDRSFPLRGKITGGYITSALAKTEAVERGFDDAIMLNTQGKVSEGSAMNIFLVRKGKLITPSVNQDILEGITRDAIIILAKDLGIEVEERAVDKSELLIADEIFLSGTAARLTSVSQVEGYCLTSTTPIADKIKQKLTAITLGQDTLYDEWITRVVI